MEENLAVKIIDEFKARTEVDLTVEIPLILAIIKDMGYKIEKEEKNG